MSGLSDPGGEKAAIQAIEKASHEEPLWHPPLQYICSLGGYSLTQTYDTCRPVSSANDRKKKNLSDREKTISFFIEDCHIKQDTRGVISELKHLPGVFMACSIECGQLDSVSGIENRGISMTPGGGGTSVVSQAMNPRIIRKGTGAKWEIVIADLPW
jgi:hypothetical protein